MRCVPGDLGVHVGVQAWRLWFNCKEAWERSGDFLERAIRRVGSCIYLCTGFTYPLFLPPLPHYPQLCSLRLLSSRQVCQTPLLALRGLVPGSFPWGGGEWVPLVLHIHLSGPAVLGLDCSELACCERRQEAPASP